MESLPSSTPASKKLKYTEAVHDIMEIDGDEAPVGILSINGKTDKDNIVKASKMIYGKNLDNQLKDPLTEDQLVPSTSADPDPMNGIPQISLDDFDHGSENSDDVDDDDASYYDPDELLFEEDFSSYDDTLDLQAQFDAADLPSGIEAPVPWLEERAKRQTKLAATSSSSSFGHGSEEEEEAVLKKYTLFKKFDTVEDFSDHHYHNQHGSAFVQASREWTKTIHHEWSILMKDLPDTIFVRVYEERMDLLRAAIIGAAGTPYHDGLFFFDMFFPADYPNVPPLVHYHSGGLRLNPNLYSCGKVCLSLLNTWSGSANEKWTPGTSTVLQVLLSIQALVLNEKPFFNEPGYERMSGRKEGEKRAKGYNENTFVLSCKTMLYLLHRPPKYFEDFVVGHFRVHAQAILEACKAYIKGVQVGHPIESEVHPLEENDKGKAQSFKKLLRTVVASLVPAFIKNGAKECERFIPLGDVNRTAPLKL